MSNFVLDLSHAIKRLRKLLKIDSEWQFLPEHREDFNTVKSLMADTNDLVAFSKSRNKICDAQLRFPVFGPELIDDPWLDREQTYTCKMVNATVDEDIREDPLLADILMKVV